VRDAWGRNNAQIRVDINEKMEKLSIEYNNLVCANAFEQERIFGTMWMWEDFSQIGLFN